ncbi:MAG: IclR family transcriptional regulator [Caulobacteraceae bacterium]
MPRAFAVLEVLAGSPEPMRLSAVALRLGLQKSTSHRILQTLVGLGYVEQVQETGCYAAGLRLWELGEGIATAHPVKRAAAGFMQDLHRTTGETVSLTILSGDDVLYLDKIISPRPVRFTTRVGSRVPAVLTSGGKAILAYAADGAEIAGRSAGNLGGRRRTTVENVLEELEEVRRNGYATSSFNPGIVSFAAPVMSRDGQAAAALSVSAPTERLSAAKRREVIEAVRSACAHMAERVGRL